MRVIATGNVAETNVDIPSSTIVLGPLSSNTLRVDPSFASTDVDEMALSYITGQYSQINYGFILTTDAATSVIYASPVSPSAFWFRAGAAKPFCNTTGPLNALNATTNCFYPSNVFYAASCFRQWRGSFRFKFTFAKTKFHAGRVMVWYIPTKVSVAFGGTDTLPTVAAPEALGGLVQPFGYSAIFDLKDGNVFEFDVPYVNAMPYADFFANTGSIGISVVDPLLAPTTVATSVGLLVEVKALPDFEVSVPLGPRYPPIVCDSASKIRLQAGQLLPTTSGPTDQMCVGEKVTSVKQLIMIPVWKSTGTLAVATVGTFGLPPWWFQGYLAPTVPAIQSPWPTMSFSWGGYFASGYTFVRGGTDYHVYCNVSNGAGNATATVVLTPQSGNNIAPSAFGPNNPPTTCLPRVTTSDLNKGLHIRVPNYLKTARALVSSLYGIGWQPSFTAPAANSTPVVTQGDAIPTSYPRLTVVNTTAGVINGIFSRSASDDAQLGQYIGPPYLGLLNTVASALYYDTDSSILF